MDQQATATLAAALLAAFASFVTLGFERYAAREERRRRTGDLMAKYHEPLLRSAQELQSRLWNIVCGRYLGAYYDPEAPDASESRYAVNSTMYAVAEYLCWREIVRRERPYLDLGDVANNTALMQKLQTIEDKFATDQFPLRLSPKFRVFRHRQRAMGEVLMVDRTQSGPVRLDCIGFAAFTRRVEATESDFAAWFKPLAEDIRALAVADSLDEERSSLFWQQQHRPLINRLIHIQEALIGLVDLLDPDHRLVPQDREKIEKAQCGRSSANGTSSTPERTAAMTRIVTEAQALARQEEVPLAKLTDLFNEGDGGRIAALARVRRKASRLTRPAKRNSNPMSIGTARTTTNQTFARRSRTQRKPERPTIFLKTLGTPPTGRS
jgi:hypothetical protein